MRGFLACLLALAAAFSSGACAFYPRKADDFERPTCTYQNPLVLDVAYLQTIDCSGSNDAGSCLFTYAAVGPVTLVAATSAVLAGNGLYWLGNRSECSIAAYARKHSRRR